MYVYIETDVYTVNSPIHKVQLFLLQCHNPRLQNQHSTQILTYNKFTVSPTCLNCVVITGEIIQNMKWKLLRCNIKTFCKSSDLVQNMTMH